MCIELASYAMFMFLTDQNPICLIVFIYIIDLAIVALVLSKPSKLSVFAMACLIRIFESADFHEETPTPI